MAYEKTEVRDLTICATHQSPYDRPTRDAAEGEMCGLAGCSEAGVIVVDRRYKVTF